MHKIIFELGPFTLYSYGVFVASGFLVATILMLKDAKRIGVSSNDLFDCIITILIGGLIGGRLLFVVINWDYYSTNFLRIFMFYEGGLAVQGAIAAALFSGWITTKVKKLPLLKIADLIVPYVALGQSIGRIGCFFNGCCYGKIIDKGLAVTFPGETASRIPTQLYSSLLLLVLFLVLLFLRERNKLDGYVLSMYLILYSIFRFFMDFLRGDELFMVFNLTLSQLISIIMFIGGLSLYFILTWKKKHLS